MISINLEKKNVSIEINGEAFPVLLGEYDISKRLSTVRSLIDKKRKKELSFDEINEIGMSIANAIDAIIGEGAFVKLAAGRSVNLMTAIEWLSAVARAAIDAHIDVVKKAAEAINA